MTLATKVTLVRIALVPVFIACYYLDIPYGAFVTAGVFALASLTDFLDGYLARKYNQVSNLGKFLDPLADKLLVTAAMVMLVFDGTLHPVICVLFISRDLVVNGVRMMAASNGEVIAAAWKAKVKTAVQIIAIILLIINNFPFAMIGLDLGNILIAVALVFSIWTMIEYMRDNRKFIGL